LYPGISGKFTSVLTLVWANDKVEIRKTKKEKTKIAFLEIVEKIIVSPLPE